MCRGRDRSEKGSAHRRVGLGRVTAQVVAALVVAIGLLTAGCEGEKGYCDSVSDWDPDWVAWEARILELMNEARAAGATCGSTAYEATGSLTVDPLLRCAARNHSRDMSKREFFDHVNPDGDGPTERFDRAGWSGTAWGENIVGGYGSPDAQFAGWMSSEGHCANIMNSYFTVVGIGFYHGSGTYGDYTTAGFGRP